MRVPGVAFLFWFAALAGMAHAVAQEEDGANGDPLPISISAKPASVWVGRPVTLAGDSVATATMSSITITVRPPTGGSLPTAQFKLSLDGGGRFSQVYTPRAAGTYQVDAIAPDGRGRAQATLQVMDPASPGAETGDIIGESVGDAMGMVAQIKSDVTGLPPNPAKDELLQAIEALDMPLQQLQAQAVSASKPIANLIRLSSRLRLTDALETERDALLADLAAAEEARKHTREVLDRVKNHHTTCDDLEVVVEGFKWTGVLLNFAVANPSAVAANFARDLIAAAASGAVQMTGGVDAAQFGTSEVVKSKGIFSVSSYVGSALSDINAPARFEHLHLDANTIVSRVNDFAGQQATQTMAKYCVELSGPVKAHMHAQFYKSGVKWWEYSFDLIARLTLHYPRNASGDQIEVNGHMEGYGTNFKLWENALSVQFPSLMSSTVQKKIVIPPLYIPATASGALPAQYSSEGSVFSALTTPNAFFFQTTGVVSKDKLQFTVGAVRTDQKPTARVVAILVPALTAGLPTWSSYSLPYKEAHFVFDRTHSNVFEVPLTTVGKTITGQQHFSDKRDNEDARGEYSVDVKVCNPGC